MIRLTSFERWVICIVLSIIILILCINLNVEKYAYLLHALRMIGIVVPIVLMFFFSMIISSDVSEAFPLKYKIVENEHEIYEAKVLRLWWLFVFMWRPVDTETHSYKSQNMFGAKYKDYYSTDVIFNSKHAAIDAINKHKKQAKKERDSFFKRPEKKKIKTIYL